jgi:hypothetical protein
MGRRVLCDLRVPHHGELARQAAGPRLVRRSRPSNPSRVLYLPARHRVCRRPDRCGDSGGFGREVAGVQCADRVHPKKQRCVDVPVRCRGNTTRDSKARVEGFSLDVRMGTALLHRRCRCRRSWAAQSPMVSICGDGTGPPIRLRGGLATQPGPPGHVHRRHAENQSSNSRRRRSACIVMESAATSRTRFLPAYTVTPPRPPSPPALTNSSGPSI